MMTPQQLTDTQLKALSEIAADIGQVCLASMVMPFLVSGLDGRGLFMLVSGLILSLLFWVAGVALAGRVR